jgi:hypothetical protein
MAARGARKAGTTVPERGACRERWSLLENRREDERASAGDRSGSFFRRGRVKRNAPSIIRVVLCTIRWCQCLGLE